MRIAGFITSMLGAIGAGGLGLSWLRNASCREAHGSVDSWLPGGDPVILSAYLLVVALVLACIGGLFVLQGRQRTSGTLLLIAGIGPGLIEPRAFVVTFLLILAGLIAHGLRATPVGRAGPVAAADHMR